ncbi:Putative predicted metal-dependent hydrolase [Moritella viscosa]|uniref:M48 family metallopeptidase n=1 Tax=Moritella viscosa TaxID=80854 RepID=UPI000508F2A7|nr:SprT family zinc-dependent metalloprotease [Moritella viscosa]CED61474.1 putative uncharacterized protein [Moritella viscosa]SHO05472.1 Putative predicted metal-dependent hydrolase [Moritella viscosa]SHO21431.1 Putative predicted metal-dependent hydrolase [Moritella viscosa]
MINNTKTIAFRYGDDIINYEVVRKAPILKDDKLVRAKITIKVHPDCRVVVSAPEKVTADDIHQAVLKQVSWIWKSLEEFKAHQDYVLPKRYVSGEMQFYLGRRYVLKIVEDKEASLNVKLLRGKLQVTLPTFNDSKSELSKALVNKWYKHRARLIFQQRLKVLTPQASWVTDLPSFKIKAMNKQWGNCSPNGTLTLNPHLVKAPKECIDYVILHELCHIEELNHSDKFWRLLTQVMPHWKDVKAKLDGMAELYLNE